MTGDWNWDTEDWRRIVELAHQARGNGRTGAGRGAGKMLRLWAARAILAKRIEVGNRRLGVG